MKQITKNLRDLLDDFETGRIANASCTDKDRLKHEKTIRQLLDHIDKREIISNKLGESL